jgi:hypothetical protein
MPPRFAYWTIILDGAPTSFRTKEREEILPLFNQLKAKNPAALLKWFSGGRLWDSPEQAKDVRDVEKVRRFREERAKEAKAQHEGGEDPLAEFRRQHGRPADGSDQPAPANRAVPGSPEGEDRPWSRGASAPRASRPPSDRRGKDWRPGGEHKDPRDKYKLPPGEARKRWKDRNLGPRVPRPFGSKPGGDRPYGDRPRGDRPFGSKPGGDRPYGDRPRSDRPFGSKPGGDRPYGDRPRGDPPFGGRPGGDRPFGDRPFGGKPGGPPSTRERGERSLRPGKPFGSKPGGDRPFGDRPRGPKQFGSKPGGDRPFGGKPRGPGGGRPFGGKPGRPGGKPGGPRGKR